MRDVLLIAYYFPPLTDSAVLRNVGICNYLPKEGFNPVVLTVSNPDLSYCSVEGEEDSSISNVTVIRSRSVFNLNRIISGLDNLFERLLTWLGFKWKKHALYQLIVPDIFLGWIPLTVLKAYRLCKRIPIDILFASCKPVSGAVIGVLVKKLTGRKLVLDLQDPWRGQLVLDYSHRQHQAHSYPLQIKQWIDRILETWVLKNVDQVLVTTEETKNMYVWAYPFVASKISVIYNGFSEIFESSGDLPPFKKFTLLYTGNYYYHVDRSEAIFNVLARLYNRGVVTEENFQFVMIGRYGKWLDELIDRYGLGRMVRAVGHLPRHEVRDYMERSAVLYIRLFRPCVNLSIKAFEGLAVGIPILGHMEEGEQARLIKQYARTCWVVPPDDREETALGDALCQAIQAWKKGELVRQRNRDYLCRFNPQQVTAELAAVLRKL